MGMAKLIEPAFHHCRQILYSRSAVQQHIRLLSIKYRTPTISTASHPPSTEYRSPCVTTISHPIFGRSSKDIVCVANLSIQTRSTSTSLDRNPIPGNAPNTPVRGLLLDDPEKGQLVYYGSKTKLAKRVKLFTLSTTGITLALQPLILPNLMKLPLAFQFALGGMLSMFMFGTTFLIHSFVRVYVTDLYYNRNTNIFTATTLTFLSRKKVTKFTPEEAQFPATAALYFMKVRGMRLFLDPGEFRCRDAYIKLMGYDKPMDMSGIEDFNKDNRES